MGISGKDRINTRFIKQIVEDPGKMDYKGLKVMVVDKKE